MKQSSSRPGGINRRQFMAASAASLAGAALARPGLARAAGYPSEHPIQFIVPFPAGGGTDLCRGRWPRASAKRSSRAWW
ncbi:hypothetical protein WJ971_29520 [Achromobacter xylosoxidans]